MLCCDQQKVVFPGHDISRKLYYTTVWLYTIHEDLCAFLQYNGLQYTCFRTKQRRTKNIRTTAILGKCYYRRVRGNEETRLIQSVIGKNEQCSGGFFGDVSLPTRILLKCALKMLCRIKTARDTNGL